MTQRRILIGFAIGVLLVEIIMISGLKLLRADPETIVFAYLLLLCGAGLGVGEIITRFPRQ